MTKPKSAPPRKTFTLRPLHPDDVLEGRSRHQKIAKSLGLSLEDYLLQVLVGAEKPRPRGRPPKIDANKARKINFSVDPSVKNHWIDLATEEKMTLNEFVLTAFFESVPGSTYKHRRSERPFTPTSKAPESADSTLVTLSATPAAHRQLMAVCAIDNLPLYYSIPERVRLVIGDPRLGRYWYPTPPHDITHLPEDLLQS